MGTRFFHILIGITLLTLSYASAPAADPSIYVYGDDWLKDSGGAIPNGVPVCSQSAGKTCDGQKPIGTPWECPELAQRLYFMKGWDTDFVKNNNYTFLNTPRAADIYYNAQASQFEAFPNNSVADIKSGDMIVHSEQEPGTENAGHVAIVDTVIPVVSSTMPNPVKATITVKEENRSGTGEATSHMA